MADKSRCEQGVLSVLLDKDSRDMTAFCSPWGKFTFSRMPFGLINAPATPFKGVYKTAFPNNQNSAQLTLTMFLSIPLPGRNIWNTSEVCRGPERSQINS